jgi:uncharacterized protein YukE
MIELTVHGDPAACRTAAQRAAAVAASVGTAVSDVRAARGTSSAAWQGRAGDAFRATLATRSGDLDDLEARIRPAVRALESFADELQVVKDRLAQVRATATGAGLVVSGDTVQPPTAVPGAADQAEVDAHDDKVRAYNTAFAQAEDARAKEVSAHSELTSAMSASNGDGWLENLAEKLGFAPPDGMDAVTGTAWVLGLGGLGFGTATGTMLKGVLQVFQPRVNGQFGSAAGLGFWERLRAAGPSSSWHAKPYQALSRDRWAAAGKWASRAGTVVTAAASGWEQWQADADDPSLDTGERVDRAATKGVSTAAGAYVGAEAGAWAGGAIGTAICPGVGTVIGAGVGGLVGGFVGSSAGAWAGDQINAAADGIGHAAADAAGAVGDVAGDVGDAISFWD